MNTIVSKPTIIQISMLATFNFCEYLFFLEEVMDFKAPPTKAMLEGIKAHANLNGLLFLIPDTKTMIKQALLQTDSEFKKRNVRVNGEILSGSLDEIHIKSNEICIIEDKPHTPVQQAYINQVFGYCLAFKEEYKPKPPIFGVVRNLKTGKEIWRKQFDKAEERNINKIVQRILGIMQGAIKPVRQRIPEKCSRCRFEYLC